MILLYHDSYLRTFQEKKEKAELLLRAASAQYSQARQVKKEARARLDSWKHITKALERVAEPRQIAELQALLKKLPPEEELRSEFNKAALEFEKMFVEYQRCQAAYQNAATQVSFARLMNQKYGNSLQALLKEFGNIELICKYNRKKDELDIYFGGHQSPGGAGHAHWVVNKWDIIVFRRDPERGQEAS